MNRSLKIPGRHGSRSTGFTIVEVIVVVAILALLLSMLLPSLNKARDVAFSMRCAANMKQVACAWNLYINDYKGAFPSTNSSTFSFEKMGVEEILSPYTNVTAMVSNWSTRQVGGGIWLCPASGVTVNATLWSGNPGYVKPSGNWTSANTYTGLYYHWSNYMTTPTNSSSWRNCWRQDYFSRPIGVPIQWCDKRFYNDVPADNSLNRPSFHGTQGELGRPTAFLDGHAKVLTSVVYTNSFQAIESANASIPGGSAGSAHSYYNYDYSAAQAADYALSEY